jgi:dolichyl-phosphate-mannose--protein O-mannosyl transferase
VYRRRLAPREMNGALHELYYYGFSVLLLCFLWFQTIPAVKVEGDDAVTWGSVIKLVHQSTGYRLHSHEIVYGTGSGQQSVTAYPFGGDNNSFWRVKREEKANNESNCSPVACGSWLRLEHLTTRKNLHSHLPKSPLSGNLEVSAFGIAGQGDSGDVFQLVCNDYSTKYWKRGEGVYFKHVDTNAFLYSSMKYVYPEPIEGHLEVSGHKKKNSDCLWKADDGFYLR